MCRAVTQKTWFSFPGSVWTHSCGLLKLGGEKPLRCSLVLEGDCTDESMRPAARCSGPKLAGFLREQVSRDFQMARSTQRMSAIEVRTSLKRGSIVNPWEGKSVRSDWQLHGEPAGFPKCATGCSACTYRVALSFWATKKKNFSAKINMLKEQKLGELWLPCYP